MKEMQGLGQNEFPDGQAGRTQAFSINVSDFKFETLCQAWVGARQDRIDPRLPLASQEMWGQRGPTVDALVQTLCLREARDSAFLISPRWCYCCWPHFED